jgi:hypothetical protein
LLKLVLMYFYIFPWNCQFSAVKKKTTKNNKPSFRRPGMWLPKIHVCQK